MRTYTALINPISGGGRALSRWRPISEALAARGIHVKVEMTRSQQHAVEAAAAAAQRGDVVIAVGGDGLVRDVAAGVLPAGATMAIVPGGRGNDLARKLELPADPHRLAAMIAGGVVRRLDVIDAGGHVALGNLYVGVDSVANEAINNNRWLPGLLVYRLAPIGAVLRWKAAEYTLTEDGSARTVRLHTVVVANSGSYGHGLKIVPSAELDDGLLHVLTVADGPRRKVIEFMSQAKTGKHVENSTVAIRTVTQVTISAERQIPVYVDGDYLCELPVTVTVRRSALDMLAPQA